MDPDATELADLADRMARAAGRLLVERFSTRHDDVTTKSSSTDMVTAADRSAERLIVEALTAERPDDGLLGEEGSERTGSTGVRWVIDPLDGTTNYLYGFPGWAVSIAAEHDGDLVAGAVAVPSLGEHYAAARGQGARCGDRPLRIGSPPPLARALCATGFSYSPEVRRQQASALVTVLPAVRDVRRMGAAAVDLCAVAAGRVDAYFERGLSPWDMAAGTLIAREAGATVSDGRGGQPSAERIVAAAAPLHDALCELLQQADLS